MSRPVVRTFWHGPPLGYYHRACLASFVAKGIDVELFTYDPALAVPAGVSRRDAREIHDGDVLLYRQGFGAGRASLHANLFRLEMLHRLGGWWVDTDVMLLGEALPATNHFIGRYDAAGPNNAVLALPVGSPIARRCIAEFKTELAENAKPRWGELGPNLITRVMTQMGAGHIVQPAEVAYPLSWTDLILMLDPRRRAEAEAKCARAVFLHLWDGWWRDAAIPMDFLPPAGSFLDALIPQTVSCDGTLRRMKVSEVRIWCRNRDAVAEAARLRHLVTSRSSARRDPAGDKGSKKG